MSFRASLSDQELLIRDTYGTDDFSKPYLVRAIHEWILDNELTPYLLVNAELPGVEVPEDFVDDGKIILNLSPEAIRNLVLDNHWCCFTAKFSNIAKDIRLPMISIPSYLLSGKTVKVCFLMTIKMMNTMKTSLILALWKITTMMIYPQEEVMDQILVLHRF